MKEPTIIKNWLQRKFLKGILSTDVPSISIANAYTNKTQKIFLDARESREFEISHLPNALYVGFDDFSIHALKKIQKHEQIVVYCSIGLRSEKITKILLNEGYTHVENLYGGIFEWVNQGFEIVDSNGMKTEKIHVFNKKFGAWVKKGEKYFS